MKNRILTQIKQAGLIIRSVAARWRIHPFFIIAGVQKGGTTSLFAYLDQHPQLKLSRPKEVHFFDENYEKGMSFYKRYFPLKFSKKRTGEASPYYIFHPWVADRIKKELPATKIIVVLRNPIYRAYSHYHMQKRRGIEPCQSFEEAIEAEKGRLEGEKEKMLADKTYNSVAYKRFSYAERGMYAEQVQRWLNVFGVEKILFIKSEDLLAQPESELKKVYTFLGLDESLPNKLSKKHVAKYPEIKKETLEFLKEKYREDQVKLTRLIGERFKWF